MRNIIQVQQTSFKRLTKLEKIIGILFFPLLILIIDWLIIFSFLSYVTKKLANLPVYAVDKWGYEKFDGDLIRWRE